MHVYRAANPHQLDKPSATLQPKTSLETPRDLAIGQAVQEIQTICEWGMSICLCVLARDRKLFSDWHGKKTKHKTQKTKQHNEHCYSLCWSFFQRLNVFNVWGQSSADKWEAKVKHVLTIKSKGGHSIWKQCQKTEGEGRWGNNGSSTINLDRLTYLLSIYLVGQRFPFLFLHTMWTVMQNIHNNSHSQSFWPWVCSTPTHTNTKQQY